MTSQEKAELFDTFCRLKSATMVAPPLQNKLCSVRTIVKKKENETCEVIAAAMPAGMKILHLLQNIPFYIILKMHLLYGYKTAMRKEFP